MRAAIAALSLLVACAQPLDPDTGATVEVRRGPIQPVSQVGVDNSAPVSGAQVRLRDERDRTVASAETGADGLAIMPAPPGSYRAVVVSCPGALALPTPEPVTISDGQLTPVRLECDTGIR